MGNTETTSKSSDGQLPAPQSLVKPMRRVVVMTAIAFLLAVPLAAALGWWFAGSQGLWGALLGLAMPVLFFSVTSVVALVTARMKPEALGVVVLATWLLKIILLIGFLVLIEDADFYDVGVMFVTLLLGTIGYLVMEAVVVTRTKVLYVETEFAP